MHREEPVRTRGLIVEREPVTRVQADDAYRAHDLHTETRPGATIDWRHTLTGTLVALTTLLMLGLLGLAIGLTTFNAATAATEGALPRGLGSSIALWGAMSLFIAFFVGGHTAAKLSGISDQEQGAWRALPVFLLAAPLLLWLLLGGLAGGASMLAGTVAGLHVDPAVQARANPTAVGDIAGHLRDVTWGALFGCLLGLAGSALGGMVAGQRRRMTRRSR
ncbi:MAG TPA: hypothetical protein VGQ62_04520 [Chloroflexota bacterium]|jgi:hypothetical protein|nr:hypothetical protein [Chloroflexota bacterium]